ncbi:MAG: low molecular weight phosphatase family protein [Hyphomicrobiales bacterium]
MTGELPGAILFACSLNAIRSPMAAAMMRHFYGHRVFVASCGVRAGEDDPFVHAVLEEIGIALGRHRPQSFDDLEDTNFDVVVSLSPEAHHRALELTRTSPLIAEYWPTLDPSVVTGSREQILDAYRDVRDGLYGRIRQRFGPLGARGV